MTIFDKRKALWMWQFSRQAEASITAVAETAKPLAGSDLVLVKAMDGTDWMRLYDPAPAAIASLDVWNAAVQEADAAGIQILPWVVPHGPADAAAHAPVSSIVVVDLEPYSGFWTADPSGIPAYLQALRNGGVGELHVSIDPRPSAVQSVNLPAWAGLVDGLLPQLYWTDFGQDALEVLPMLRRLQAFGTPVYPVLPGNGTAQDLADVWRLAQALRCSGCSAWRLGSMDAAQLAAFAALQFQSASGALAGSSLQNVVAAAEQVLRAIQQDLASASTSVQQALQTLQQSE